jgi:tetratricopeptide (TPR) repeat protein
MRHAVRRRSAAAVALLAAVALGDAVPVASGADATLETCADLARRALGLLAQAEAAEDTQKARAAAELLERATRVCPENPDWPFYRALAYVAAKDEDRARAAAVDLRRSLEQRAAALNRRAAEVESDPRTLYLQAMLHFRFGNMPARSLDLITRLRARDPTFMASAVQSLEFNALLAYSAQLAHAAQSPNRETRDRWLAEADKQARLAIEVVRGDVKREDVAKRNRGEILRASERWPEAHEVFADLVQRNPDDAVVRYSFASVLATQFSYADALVQWDEVLRLARLPGTASPLDAPQLADAPLRRAVTLVLASRVKEGREALLDYVKAKPQDPRGWYYLGKFALEAWDAPGDAVRWLEKAREIDPWCEATLRLLRTLYTTHVPDVEKAARLDATLDDPGAVAARKREMDRRTSTRADRGNGCE